MPDKEYRVITNNFMASGGDGLRETLKKVEPSRIKLLYDQLPIREQLAKFWRENRPVINSADNPVMPTRRMRAKNALPNRVCPKKRVSN